MTPDAAKNEIIQAFKTWWEARHVSPAIPVSYPDVAFDAPDDPPWVRITLHWSGTNAAGASRREDWHTGYCFVELYWPPNVGYHDADVEAEAIRQFLRDLSLNGGRVQCKGIVDGERPFVSTPGKEPGFTRRLVNAPVRLMEPL